MVKTQTTGKIKIQVCSLCGTDCRGISQETKQKECFCFQCRKALAKLDKLDSGALKALKLPSIKLVFS